MYYRQEVPAKVVEAKGLGAPTWARWWEVTTEEDKERATPEMLNHDFVVFYCSGGTSVERLLDFLDVADTMVAVATFAKVEEEGAGVPGAEAVTPAATEPELSVERGKKEDEGEE